MQQLQPLHRLLSRLCISRNCHRIPRVLPTAATTYGRSRRFASTDSPSIFKNSQSSSTDGSGKSADGSAETPNIDPFTGQPEQLPEEQPTERKRINVQTFERPEEREREVKLKTYKPRTPGVRHLRRPINEHLWKGRPFKALTIAKKGQGKGGRNHTGQITVRHRGAGHKRRIRIVDFERKEPGPHTVDRIEYDPNRSGHIALITNPKTKRKSYILAPDGLRAGDTVTSYRAGIPDDLLASMGGIIDPGMLAARTAFRGNCLPLHMVPIGCVIMAIGSSATQGAKFCRSAGTHGIVVGKDEDKWVTVKLQSGEIRRVSRDAAATIGVVSNPDWQHRQLGKAGRSRWLGIRPTVRGMAMNAVDHPHGGGRGKSKGNVHPVSPWGKLAKGGWKTRKVGKTNKWVVEPRPRIYGRKNKQLASGKEPGS